MHVVAGFESQIAALGGAFAVADAARTGGLVVTGAALARRDSGRGIHVDPLAGFDLPPHVLSAIDTVIDAEDPADVLLPGQAAFVVSSASPAHQFATAVDKAALGRLGALWVSLVPAE